MSVRVASTPDQSISCGQCGSALRLGQYSDDGRLDCLSCGQRHRVAIAPALLREPSREVSVGETALDDEATCFYHPTKRAAAVCDASGRFLCELCKVEVNGRTYSMEAFQNLRQEGADERFVEQETRYDRAALALAVLPPVSLFLLIFTIVTGPMAAGLAVFALTRRRKGPLRRGPWVALLALVLGLGQAVWWLFVFGSEMGLFWHLSSLLPPSGRFLF